MLKLKCECGLDFKREEKYKENNNVLFRWKLKYCDKCLHKRTKKALKELPELLKILS